MFDKDVRLQQICTLKHSFANALTIYSYRSQALHITIHLQFCPRTPGCDSRFQKQTVILGAKTYLV